MFCCQMEECDTHQGDRWCYGQRSNKVKKNANKASETDHDLKQWRNYYGTLDLAKEQNMLRVFKFDSKIVLIVSTTNWFFTDGVMNKVTKMDISLVTIENKMDYKKDCTIYCLLLIQSTTASNLTSLIRGFQMSSWFMDKLSVKLPFSLIENINGS